VGVPARIVGWMCRCGTRLPFAVDEAAEQATCEVCGAAYIKRNGTVQEVSE